MYIRWNCILAVLLLELAASNRLTKLEEAAKVPCACDNKVGVLAPKHALPGISIPADATCSRPKVHASLTGGRYCSCDKGKAKNWKEALGMAQAEADAVLLPKLEALNAAVAELEESLGVKIDASSLTKVKLSVTGFPREQGKGTWACCCQSQAAGKCTKDAQMESSMWKRGFHHEAPIRACDEEAEATVAVETTPNPAGDSLPVPESSTTLDSNSAGFQTDEEESTSIEDEATTTEATGPSSSSGSAAVPPAPRALTPGAAATVSSSDTAEESVATSSAAPLRPAGHQDLMAAIRSSNQANLRSATEGSSEPETTAAPDRRSLFSDIQGFQRSQLKKAEDRERKAESRESTPSRGNLLGEIQAFQRSGLKKASDRKPEVERPAQDDMMSHLREHLGKMRAAMQGGEAESEDTDDDEEWK